MMKGLRLSNLRPGREAWRTVDPSIIDEVKGIIDTQQALIWMSEDIFQAVYQEMHALMMLKGGR